MPSAKRCDSLRSAMAQRRPRRAAVFRGAARGLFRAGLFRGAGFRGAAFFAAGFLGGRLLRRLGGFRRRRLAPLFFVAVFLPADFSFGCLPRRAPGRRGEEIEDDLRERVRRLDVREMRRRQAGEARAGIQRPSPWRLPASWRDRARRRSPARRSGSRGSARAGPCRGSRRSRRRSPAPASCAACRRRARPRPATGRGRRG